MLVTVIPYPSQTVAIAFCQLPRPLHLNNVLITPNTVKILIFVSQFVRDNNCTIEFDAFGFSIKDSVTRQVLLQCDSTGDLYPVMKPYPIPQVFLSSQHTWYQRLGHLGSEVLRPFGRHLEEIHVTWAQFRKKRDKIATLHEFDKEKSHISNWLEHLLAGSISTWEDLTTRFLAQFSPPRRTAKLRNDILIFQQHQGESLSEAWTRFKDLLQKVPHHGIDLWLKVKIFYDHVNPATRRTIDQSAGGKLRDKNAKESWALIEDLALYDNKSWNDPRDFVKPVKEISLHHGVPNTSDHRLIELENQFQCLMEAHLALKPSVQVNKIASSCEICSGPHDTQYCMENPEQAFLDYASSRTDEAGVKWFTFKPEQNNLGDTYNPSWKIHPNLRWRRPQNSQNNFSNPPNRLQSNGSLPNRPFNNNPQNFNNQSNIEGLVSNFMESQDARLSKFEADFKQQQSEMTNKIDTFLKAINDRTTRALPSDMVKNPKLNVNPTSSVSSTRSYPMKDPQRSSRPFNLVNAIKTCFKPTNDFQKDQLQVKTLTVNKIGTPKSKEPEKALED
ncbi:MAK10-like protein [Tanacetum coccineum]